MNSKKERALKTKCIQLKETNSVVFKKVSVFGGSSNSGDGGDGGGKKESPKKLALTSKAQKRE